LTDELKILIHIGSHLNILNVLGAVTQDLDNGQMFGFFCCIFTITVRLNAHYFNFTADPVKALRFAILV